MTVPKRVSKTIFSIFSMSDTKLLVCVDQNLRTQVTLGWIHQLANFGKRSKGDDGVNHQIRTRQRQTWFSWIIKPSIVVNANFSRSLFSAAQNDQCCPLHWQFKPDRKKLPFSGFFWWPWWQTNRSLTPRHIWANLTGRLISMSRERKNTRKQQQTTVKY